MKARVARLSPPAQLSCRGELLSHGPWDARAASLPAFSDVYVHKSEVVQGVLDTYKDACGSV